MTQEKKAWLEKTANIIDQLQKRYHYSDACVNVECGSVFFDDSCNYVDLIYELNQLVTTLRGMIKFSELGEHKPEDK